MRVAYPMNFFPDKIKPHSNISRAATVWGLTVHQNGKNKLVIVIKGVKMQAFPSLLTL